MKQIFKITKEGEETLCFENKSDAIITRNALHFDETIEILDLYEEDEFSVEEHQVTAALSKLNQTERDLIREYFRG